MTEQEGKEAWKLNEMVIENEKKRRQLLFDNMKYLAELHNTGLFRAVLGDGEAPWSAYLGQHEVFYSRSQVYNYVKIYNKFIKELKLDSQLLVNIPYSLLYSLIRVVNENNVIEWLDKAKSLTTQDFRDELRIAEGKESYNDCKHKDIKLYSICPTCGYRHLGEHQNNEKN